MLDAGSVLRYASGVPNDNPPSSGAASVPASGIPFRWGRADGETALLILGLKALIFLFAALSMQTLFDREDNWMEIWNRWDARHYLSLAEHGYTAEGERRFSIVFYPLYPWLVRTFAFFARDYIAAAFLVSGVASVIAGLILRRLAELDFSAAVARQTVWFLFIFPTSYFLHIGYTESLFLALVLGSVLAARTDHWAAAGLLGALACLTRVNGLILVPTLMVEAWLQYRVRRQIDWRWLWIGAAGAGFVGYLFLNYQVTGDFFAFSAIMEVHWYKKFTPPWEGIYDLWVRIPVTNTTEGWHEFSYIVLGFLCTVWSWFKLRPSYAVWITLNWLLITSTAFVVSVPRYCLTLFPIFILFALLAEKRPLAGRLLTAVSLLFLALFATKFVFGTWAF
jgi:hypothetical protein